MVEKIAELLIEHGAVLTGDFVLASGAKSSYYLDVKTAITSPVVLAAIGKEISRMERFEVVAGVAVGGVPLAVAVSLASGKPYAIIRDKEKSHGRGGRVIGTVAGKDVLLVEDVTTSGGSVLSGIDALRDEGATVGTVVTVVDRLAGAEKALAGANVRLKALVTGDELLKRAAGGT